MQFTIKDIRKALDYIDTKVKQKILEKSYGQHYPIKYLLYENESPYLAVIFSSCTRIGIKARYNYVRTLERFKINKLFILDEYGEDGRGCYYLGHNRDFTIKNNTDALIQYIQLQRRIKETIYCGSSKGGWAALYFGMGGGDHTLILLLVLLSIYWVIIF